VQRIQAELSSSRRARKRHFPNQQNTNIATHLSRNREKEKRIIQGENGEMNTTMANFA
jgi:hypothetical protein